MPVISDLYSSKHLKPADLGGKPETVTVKEVTVEAFQNDGDNVRKALPILRSTVSRMPWRGTTPGRVE
jgi:hypothetical protein